MSKRRERGAVSIAALVLGGLATVGVAAGAGVALGGGDDDAAALPLTRVGFYACAGDPEPIGDFHRGDRVVATGRDDSGDWLEVRGPDLSSRVWVPARFVVADAATGELPAAECTSEADGAANEDAGANAATPDDPQSPAAPGAPGSSGGSGGSGGGPRDTGGPAIGAISATPADIYEQFGGGSSQCINQVTSTITVPISDPSGVTSASFAWSFPGANGSGALSGSGTYQGSLGPFPYGAYAVPSGGVDVTVTVTATDGAGNTSTGSRTVRLHSAEECIV